jgi:hypothetical protein
MRNTVSTARRELLAVAAAPSRETSSISTPERHLHGLRVRRAEPPDATFTRGLGPLGIDKKTVILKLNGNKSRTLKLVRFIENRKQP